MARKKLTETELQQLASDISDVEDDIFDSNESVNDPHYQGSTSSYSESTDDSGECRSAKRQKMNPGSSRQQDDNAGRPQSDFSDPGGDESCDDDTLNVAVHTPVPNVIWDDCAGKKCSKCCFFGSLSVKLL
jgi:hypothetical protein